MFRIVIVILIYHRHKPIDQSSSIWVTRTPGGTRRHLMFYAKTSYGACKIKKSIIL
jgi:hypothetical protein